MNVVRRVCNGNRIFGCKNLMPSLPDVDVPSNDDDEDDDVDSRELLDRSASRSCRTLLLLGVTALAVRDSRAFD